MPFFCNGTLSTCMSVAGGRRKHLKGRVLLASVSLLVIIGALFLPVTSAAAHQTVNIRSWHSGTPYSAGSVEVGASGAYSGTLYYVGGQIHPGGMYTNAVYFATIHSDGSISSWKMSPYSYPGAKGIWALSCPAYSGFVYCIGGNREPGGTTNAVYFASISPSGLGKWNATTSYPMKIRFESCVPYSGYMYCVGGSPSANSATKAAFYAPILSQGGLGKWAATTSYPISAWTHCVAFSGYIYCETDYNGVRIINLTYYASISSGGIGRWKSGPAYPITEEKMQCIENKGSMYCVGGGNGVGGIDGNKAVNSVYSALLSAGGFGNWTQDINYPIPIKDHACTTFNGYIYCIGGDDPKATNVVYYSLLP